MNIMQFKTMLKNPYIINIIYVLMGLIVTIPIMGSILKSGVDCDSAYYICMGERIVEGYIPYTELHLGYTPLWFYIEAVYKILFNIPNGLYWPYLILFYAFQIAGAYFLYRLIRCLDIKESFALFAAWLYLIMAHWMQGNAVLLEVPSMTFCTLACWLVLEYKDNSCWNYLWIGCVAACSFLVKQYGLGTFALCLYLMLFISKCNWKQLAIFILGYMLPIILCFTIWGEAFINNVLLNGYGTQAAVDARYDVTLTSKFFSIVGNVNYFCYMVCPVVYVGWMFAIIAYRKNRLAQLIFAYCGILGYSLIFYFSGGLHYYQNLLPFAIVLIAEILHLTQDTKLKYIAYILVGWVILVSAYKTYHNRVYKQYIKGHERKEQRILANELSYYIKEDEALFIIHGGLYHLYFTADILPPNIETIGYSFGPMGLNEKMAIEQVQEADWVIRYSKDYDYESFFTDSLKHELEKYPSISLQDSAILLHKMH